VTGVNSLLPGPLQIGLVREDADVSPQDKISFIFYFFIFCPYIHLSKRIPEATNPYQTQSQIHTLVFIYFYFNILKQLFIQTSLNHRKTSNLEIEIPSHQNKVH